MKKFRIFYVTVPLQTNFKGLIYGPSPDEQKSACLHYIAEQFPNEEAHEISLASESFESLAEAFNPGTILVVYNKAVLFRLGIVENPIDTLSEKGVEVIAIVNDGDPQIDDSKLATIYSDKAYCSSSQVPKPYMDESLSSWLARVAYRAQWKSEVERRIRQMALSAFKGDSEDDLNPDDEV